MLFKILLSFFFITTLSARPGYFEPWGKDSDLLPQKTSTIPLPRKDLPSRIAESIILFNQNVISPTYGPRSSYRPTSSRYMLLSMRRYGFLKGFIMGCDRLLRENKDPWVYRTIEINGTLYKYDPTF